MQLSLVTVLCGDRLDFALVALVRTALAHLSAGERLIFHILIEGVSPGSLRRIVDDCQDDRLDLVFHPIGDVLTDFESPSPRGAIARLLMGEFLPRSLSRVIYLDLDVVILSSLRPLWETHLCGKALGCVADPFGRKLHEWWKVLERDARQSGHELSAQHTYFNSGVMLIDLDHWRRERTGERALLLLRQNRGLFRLFDQDVLNLLLQGQVLYLEPGWNLIEPIVNLWSWDYSLYSGLSPERSVLQPAIRHFAGSHKPWSELVRNSESRVFYEALRATSSYARAPRPAGAWWRQQLRRWLDFHWLTVRRFWWPRDPRITRPWLELALRNPLWLALYLPYFARLACLITLDHARTWKHRGTRAQGCRARSARECSS